MDSASAIVDASPQPEHRLPELFDAADALREKLRTIPGRDPVYQVRYAPQVSVMSSCGRLHIEYNICHSRRQSRRPVHYL